MTTREIFEVAVKIEEDGERFYSEVAKGAKNEDLRKFFEFMAGEERKHAQRFREIAQSVGLDETYLDSDEALAYLSEVVSGRIFPSYEDMIVWVKNRDLPDVIDYSLGMEKETVIFYLELSHVVRDEDGKRVLSEIIEEERKHIRMLMKLKREGLS